MPAPPTAAAPAPMPAAPAPVAVAPAPGTAAVPAAMMAPAHFFRLQTVGLFFRCHGGLRGTLWHFLVQTLRHQRCSLRGCGKCRDTGGYTCGYLEKFPALHVSLLQSHVMRSKCRRAVMNAC